MANNMINLIMIPVLVVLLFASPSMAAIVEVSVDTEIIDYPHCLKLSLDYSSTQTFAGFDVGLKYDDSVFTFRQVDLGSDLNPIYFRKVESNFPGGYGIVDVVDWSLEGVAGEGELLHFYLDIAPGTSESDLHRAIGGISIKPVRFSDPFGWDLQAQVVSAIRVVLVHGWRGQADTTWKELRQALERNGILYYPFDYSPGLDSPIRYAKELGKYIEEKVRDEYQGELDIVCHSMGAMVSRWYMEELSGARNIRQWIGIAPVNNGAAIANYEVIIPNVLGWLFPELPGTEEALEHMKIESSTLAWLNYEIPGFDLGVWGTPQILASGTIYRNLMGINYKDGAPAEGRDRYDFWPRLYPLFVGKTRVAKKDTKGRLYYYWTRQGDGAVAMEQSILKAEGIAGNEVFEGLNHVSILADPNVIAKVIDYLKDPSLPLINNYYKYDQYDPDDDHENDHILKGNKGIIVKGQSVSIEFPVDASMKKARILTTWVGSDLDLTLVSPSGIVMEPGVYPIIEYAEGDNSIWCVVDSPEPGIWTARIDAVDVPQEGESYNFVVFYSRPLDIQATIEINPEVLYLGSEGNWITCYIKLPEGYAAKEIDVGTVLLQGMMEVQHSDIQDGLLMVKFDRQTLLEYVNNVEDLFLTVSGFLYDETYFEGTDSIRIIDGAETPPLEELAAPAKPNEFALKQNYPNSFNPDTWIPYQLAEDVDVTIRIYDTTGHLVRTLNLGRKLPGFYVTKEKAAYWDGKNEAGEPVASGVYLYTIQAGDFTATKKMIITR